MRKGTRYSVSAAWLAASVLSAAPMVGAARTLQPEAVAIADDAKARASEEADRILFEGVSEEQRSSLVRALDEGASSLLAAEVLTRAAKGRPVPGWASSMIVAASRGFDEAGAGLMAGALAGVRSREAAAALVAMAERVTTPKAKEACLGGLVELTGRDDVGQELAGWRALVEDAASWSDERWYRAVAGWQAERASRVSNVEQRTSSRLLGTLRQIHVGTPAAERSELLATLLADALVEVRLLGIELALGELASANTLGPAVSAGSLRLLADADESVRAAAAGLVLQLSPPGASDVAAGALARETSSKAAIPLLRLAIRANEQTAVEQAIAWLESPSRVTAPGASPPPPPAPEVVRACRDAAVDLAWQLTRRGIMNAAADRARVLEALRLIPAAELSPGGCQLTGLLGVPPPHADLDRIAALMVSSDAAQRLAAAETVVVFPAYLDLLLSAALADARLVEVAVRGVQLHRQTAAGFVGIERATSGRPELRRLSLVAVAGVLPSPEVLTAIESLADEPEIKEAVLGTLARRERVTSERADGAKARAIADGLVRLARVRLRLGKAAEALAALDMTGELPAGDRPEGSELARLRACAFVRLGRLDDAQASDSDAEGWLEGLAGVIDKPFAGEALERLEAIFLGAMSEEQFARLEGIRRTMSPTSNDPSISPSSSEPK